MTVPTKPPTVTTRGSATAPTHATLEDDDQEMVVHCAAANWPLGVVLDMAKFTPTTESVLATTDEATLSTLSRALTTGAASSSRVGSTNRPNVCSTA